MAIISGILKDPAGRPIPNCTIELKALNHSLSVIQSTTAGIDVENSGYYSITVEPNDYQVKLYVDGLPSVSAGKISVQTDSADGTLNSFLSAPGEEDLTPEVMKLFQTLADQVNKAAESSKADAERSKAEADRAESAASNTTGSIEALKAELLLPTGASMIGYGDTNVNDAIAYAQNIADSKVYSVNGQRHFVDLTAGDVGAISTTDRSSATDSTSETSVATSLAVKKVNDSKLDKIGGAVEFLNIKNPSYSVLRINDRQIVHPDGNLSGTQWENHENDTLKGWLNVMFANKLDKIGGPVEFLNIKNPSYSVLRINDREIVHPDGNLSGTQWENQENDTLKGWLNEALRAISVVPASVPLPYPGTTPPPGYLKCNGAAFDTGIYPELAAAYPSGVLPDLRGEFIRGWDDGRGVDAGRSLLSIQKGSYLPGDNSSQDHCVFVYKAANKAERDAIGWDYYDDARGYYNNQVRFFSVEPFTVSSGSLPAEQLEGHGGMARPRNIAFLYIVRAA